MCHDARCRECKVSLMLFRQSCVGGGDSGYGGRATESVCSAAVLEALLRGNTPRYNWCYGKSRYYLWRHVRGCGKRSLIIEWTNTYRKCSQKHNCICNIQGVSLYTNVSANYMFRPLLVRPSSGWIPWSEEMYNSAIQPLKLGEDEISFTKMGRVYKLGVLKYAF